MLSAEEKQHYSKIKKLLFERDFEKIELGIDLIVSLNNSNLFDEFLKDVNPWTEENQNQPLKPGGYNYLRGYNCPFCHNWGGSGPDQHYFNTAILGLVNFSPKGSKGEKLRNSVENLSLNGEIKSITGNQKSTIFVKYLSNFKNLKTLTLNRYKEIKGFQKLFDLHIENLEISDGTMIPEVDKIWKFENLKILYISPDWNIKPEDFPVNFELFSNLFNLECLNFKGLGKDTTDFSLKGIENLKKLRFFKIYSSGLSNIDELKSINSLQLVNIDYERKLVNIEGLQNSKDLISLKIYQGEELQDIKPLKNLSKLRTIELYGCNKLTSLEGLENCNELINLNIRESSVENLDYLKNAKDLLILNAASCTKLQNIKGICNSLNLRELLLSGTSTLETLEGIENCNKLKVTTISGSSIKNLDPLLNSKIMNNCNQGSNDLEWIKKLDKNIQSKIDIDNIQNINSTLFSFIDKPLPENIKLDLDVYYGFSSISNYYKDYSYASPKLNYFSANNCPNLQNLEGLKNSGIQILKISNCPKIINVDYLSEFSNLQCVDFENCSSLVSVEGLINLPIDRLLLGKCYKVKPKPRFLKMDSVEKVTEYFSKFKKKKKTVSVSRANKEIIDKLKKLIISDNYEEINLGLDLASTISEIEIFDYFLDGIKFNGEKILPNPMFLAGTKKLEEFREFALRGMVSISPDGCKPADIIKSQITQTSISGSEYTSLFLVSGLTKLESLSVEDTSITIISDLSRLKNLKKLILKANLKLESLEGIKTLKSIEEIHILPQNSWSSSSPVIDLNGISELKNLKVLKIYNCFNLISLDGLENLNSIQVFDLRKCQKLNNINSLSELKSLNNISLRECESVLSIKSLEQLPNLKLLDIRFHNISDSEELSKLSKPIIESLRSGTLTF